MMIFEINVWKVYEIFALTFTEAHICNLWMRNFYIIDFHQIKMSWPESFLKSCFKNISWWPDFQ